MHFLNQPISTKGLPHNQELASSECSGSVSPMKVRSRPDLTLQSSRRKVTNMSFHRERFWLVREAGAFIGNSYQCKELITNILIPTSVHFYEKIAVAVPCHTFEVDPYQ